MLLTIAAQLFRDAYDVAFAEWDYLYHVPATTGDPPVAPPLGMRSGVPISGLGTGGFELRADGSVHDWLVENQGPGLVHSIHRSSLWRGAKVGKPELLVGLRAARLSVADPDAVAVTVRTAPPPGFPAADALTYSGAYPAAQLVVGHGELSKLGLVATLRSYAPLRVHDAEASNVPAVIFELELKNTGANALGSVGFFVSLPALVERDSARTVVGEGGGIRVPTAATAAACRTACSSTAWCAAWSLDPSTGCAIAAINASKPLPQFAEYHANGSWSGVRGEWTAPAATGGVPGGVLLARKDGPGNYFEGEQCLHVVPGPSQHQSRAISDSLHGLWSQFADHGSLASSTTDGLDDSGGGGYGAVAINTSLGPGETTVLRVVLAWHHPNRFHFGPNLGNNYASRYSGALEVASTTAVHIDAVVEGVRRWHALTLGADLARDWADFLCNSLAALAKTGMWFGDGSWRQLESFSDDDPDPVHIHLYRSLPYAALFPELDRSLLAGAYARYQNRSSGYVHENFPLGGQTNLGRTMGDTSTAFVLDVYQLWKGGGANKTWATALWPNVRLAVEFQLNRAAEWGLPTKLTSTYDWFWLETFDVTSYAAFLHLAALRAACRLGTELGVDHDFLASVEAAATAAAATLERLLWHNGTTTGGDGVGGKKAAPLSSSSSFFAAGRMLASDGGKDQQRYQPPSLLTDTLYGALWAEILGLDIGVDRDLLRQHLASEREIQHTEHGLLVWWPQNSSRADHGTNMVWNGGSLSHGALSLFLDGPGTPGIHEAERVIANYKDRVRDWWDIKDLTAGPNISCPSTPTGNVDYQPWCNSHYTRQLIGWAVPLALSRQQFDMPARQLTFAPGPGAPQRLPVFAAAFAGVLDTVERRLTVLSGSLDGIVVLLHGSPVSVVVV